MESVKVTSKILFYTTRILTFLYFSMVVLSSIALFTGWSLKLTEKSFQVNFPFTETPVLYGANNLPYIFLQFLIPLGLYGLFFLLLGNVFKVFFQPKLFTANGIKHLKRFYLGNFIVPGIMVSMVSFFDQPDKDAIVVIVLHAVIGVFAYFLAAIFKKGLNLQNEQDLII